MLPLCPSTAAPSMHLRVHALQCPEAGSRPSKPPAAGVCRLLCLCSWCSPDQRTEPLLAAVSPQTVLWEALIGCGGCGCPRRHVLHPRLQESKPHGQPTVSQPRDACKGDSAQQVCELQAARMPMVIRRTMLACVGSSPKHSHSRKDALLFDSRLSSLCGPAMTACCERWRRWLDPLSVLTRPRCTDESPVRCNGDSSLSRCHNGCGIDGLGVVTEYRSTNPGQSGATTDEGGMDTQA